AQRPVRNHRDVQRIGGGSRGNIAVSLLLDGEVLEGTTHNRPIATAIGPGIDCPTRCGQRDKLESGRRSVGNHRDGVVVKVGDVNSVGDGVEAQALGVVPDANVGEHKGSAINDCYCPVALTGRIDAAIVGNINLVGDRVD